MKTPPLAPDQASKIRSLVHEAYLSGLSIATITNNKIQASQFGYANIEFEKKVNQDTKFWACSLSKPVFAFLILKLTKNGMLPSHFMDDALPWDETILGKQDDKKPLTPRMILSHQTGLQNSGPTDFKFNPGEGFRYSGDGYLYLQKIMEQKIKEQQTGQDLESLAQSTLFIPLKMTRTSYLYPEGDPLTATPYDEADTPNRLPKMAANHQNAAASLHTTATDYARFLLACIQDADFLDLITPQILSMTKDIDAKNKNIDADTLQSIDWGLGFGLQKDKNGNIISLFHWGHGPGSRAFFDVKITHPHDPSSAVAVVYLANHENGLAIANEIASLTIGDITPIMTFLSLKYDYKDIQSPHWKAYHDLIVIAKQAEMKGDYQSAIEAYQQAAHLRPDKHRELQYRIMRAELHHQPNTTNPMSVVDLSSMTGQFGPIKITQQGSSLQIHDGSPGEPRNLTLINGDTFLDGDVILKFKREENKKPSTLLCFFPNGDALPFKRLTSTAKIAKTIGITREKLTPEPDLTKHQPWGTTEPTTEYNKAIASQILSRIWEDKILNYGEHSQLIKLFIKSIHPEKEWADLINNYFDTPENRNDKIKFIELFSQLTLPQLTMIDEGENFGITRRRELTDVTLDNSVESQIHQYLSNKGMTAATAISTSGQTLCVASSETLRDAPLCIYSVTKIFTGTLALLMVHENILKEDDLHKPIMLSDAVKNSLRALSPELAAHTQHVTLHQAMTHRAGFGDFTPNYDAAIQAAINNPLEHDFPNITHTHDFLRFDDKKIHQEQKYSNTGSLLVGLAIEHAYHQKFGEHLSFDEILRKYLIDRIHTDKPIACFSKTMPPNGCYSANMPEAKYMVASPAGGYWTSMNDLKKLGEHLYAIFKNPDLNQLLKKYGQEFTKNNGSIIYHDGAGPNASATLYVSLTTGSVIATAAINSKTHAKALAEAIERNVFTAPQNPSEPDTGHSRKQKR